MAARAKCEISAEALSALMKRTVPSLKDAAYKNEDTLYVVMKYHGFLKECVRLTDRLSKVDLKYAAQKNYEISTTNAELFASAINGAFRHCIRKRTVDGTRTNKRVNEIIKLHEEKTAASAKLKMEDLFDSPASDSKKRPRSSSSIEADDRALPVKVKQEMSPGQIHKLYHGQSPTAAMRESWNKVLGFNLWKSSGPLQIRRRETYTNLLQYRKPLFSLFS